MELLNEFYVWLSALPPLAVYAAVFAIAYLENVFPPVPGDVAIVVGGMVAATSAVALPLVVALAAAAGGLGFMTVYVAGRAFGHLILDPDRLRWLPKADIRRAEARLARNGYLVVAANRFVPGLRSVIAIAVGMSEMPPARVAALATLSATLWSALTAGLGYALVDNRDVIARVLGTFQQVGAVVLAALVVALAVWLVRARRRRAEAVGEAK